MHSHVVYHIHTLIDLTPKLKQSKILRLWLIQTPCSIFITWEMSLAFLEKSLSFLIKASTPPSLWCCDWNMGRSVGRWKVWARSLSSPEQRDTVTLRGHWASSNQSSRGLGDLNTMLFCSNQDSYLGLAGPCLAGNQTCFGVSQHFWANLWLCLVSSAPTKKGSGFHA